METKVKVQKVNSGVQFTILQNAKTGKPVTRKVTERDRKVLFAAYEWYCWEVQKAGAEHGIYFPHSFASNDLLGQYSTDKDRCAAFVALEPWGFAGGTFDAPVMGNSGSTATEGRARRLLCYQAPLNRISSGGYDQFERVITIQEEKNPVLYMTGPRFSVHSSQPGRSF